MSRRTPELVRAVEGLRATIGDMAEDIATACGGLEQVRHNVHGLRGDLQAIVSTQTELVEHAGKAADFDRYVESRFELLHDQMIEGFRSLGAQVRDAREKKAPDAERKSPNARQRLETR